MNVFELLNKQGYNYMKGDRITLGGKKLDIVAFSDREVIVFERKKHARELTTAIGQCLHYLIEANRAFVVLPEEEIKNIPKKSWMVLEKSCIGLVANGKGIEVLIEAKKNDIPVKGMITKLEQQLHGKENKKGKSKHERRIKENKEKIIEVLRKHQEGLMMKEIAKKVGIHRINIAKYIYELVAVGIIKERIAGPAKLYYLVKKEKGEKNI